VYGVRGSENSSYVSIFEYFHDLCSFISEACKCCPFLLTIIFLLCSLCLVVFISVVLMFYPMK
jgi:hypothetical protein